MYRNAAKVYYFSVHSNHSKAALKVSTPQLPQTATYDFAPKKYAGDILLRFLHTPGRQDNSSSSRHRSRTSQNIERREPERQESVDDASLQRDFERETSTRM